MVIKIVYLVLDRTLSIITVVNIKEPPMYVLAEGISLRKI